MRIGAGSAVVGAIVFSIANIVHPRSPDIEVTREQVETVADSGIWIADHFVWYLGFILIVGGLVAIQRSIEGERGAALARLGYVAALISAGLAAVLMGIDGRASKEIFDAWAAAPADEAGTALLIAEATEELNFGMFSILIVTFFGVTYALYGLSVALSTTYPNWLGWVAVVLSVVGFVVGAAVYLGGPSELLINFLFTGVSSLLVFWTLVIGVLLWRKTT